ncbi:hypothetical protein [Aeromicrobium stalagmiti]|uniref:hypothetical protein n=1 Tax=Aeromicrobium stalagmiti TaxID=2738988 RepID=UPI00156A297F|nr:hypothetical protein [Aeromicrobium stalagmiti]NRQ49517.1 hypothetical protein [Aeromicrobium stalagmiti]
MTVQMPAMAAEQATSWHALMDIQERYPDSWTLVGGQMVHLHCAERGASPVRPTDDADALLDVRAHPAILFDFTARLEDVGFVADQPTPEGHQHRWRKGRAQIDVLIPSGIGRRATRRTGVSGSTTLETPGSTQALNRSERIEVSVEGRSGVMRRPNLVGALVCKAAAHTLQDQRGRGRHRRDFALLATLLAATDLREAAVSTSDRKYLRPMLEQVLTDPQALHVAEDVQRGLDQIALLLEPRSRA